uniref:Uncharacterized protein n=1 Tax=Romanomermis culicivorax TaxID=13658 RepID=A0A915KHT7_ROMCU
MTLLFASTFGTAKSQSARQYDVTAAAAKTGENSRSRLRATIGHFVELLTFSAAALFQMKCQEIVSRGENKVKAVVMPTNSAKEYHLLNKNPIANDVTNPRSMNNCFLSLFFCVITAFSHRTCRYLMKGIRQKFFNIFINHVFVGKCRQRLYLRSLEHANATGARNLQDMGKNARLGFENADLAAGST